MRKVWLAGVAFVAAAAMPVAAFAQTPSIDSKADQAAPVDNSSAPLPDLAPGDDVAIACDPIKMAVDPSDVRVVLTIAAEPTDVQTGYKKVMAVDQKVENGAVHVKVPDAPGLENHTVDLKIYVVDGARSHDCDGGDYRIVRAPASRKPG